MIPGRLLDVYRRIFPLIRRNDFICIDAGGFWAPRSYQRRSLLRAAYEFQAMGGRTIVEVGSGIHGPMSGNSVIVWATRTMARQIMAVDLDPRRVEEVRSAAARYPNVKPIVADGKDVVRSMTDEIDMLYLDYWVADAPDTKLVGTARAESYLEMYRYARDKLARNSLILIDDTDHIDPWKQTLIIPAAREDGFQVIYIGRQTLLRRAG
jgi:hypothetical protein